MTHAGHISNHFDAMHNCLSGAGRARPPTLRTSARSWPSSPSQRNLASYVWLIKCVGDPVFCARTSARAASWARPTPRSSSARPPTTRPCPDFKPPDDLFAPATFRPSAWPDAAQLLASLNRTRRRRTERPEQWHDCSAAPSSWPTSDRAAGVRGGSRRPASVRDRYGRHPLGQNLLLARRLVEAGVGFVTVNGWTGPAPDEKLGGPPSFELGHARQQHGHGQRLRHRLLRHGLVLAAARRGAVRRC